MTLAPVVYAYQPRGAAREVFFHRDPEVLLSGPAGTGKSRACLEKVDALARKYPGSRLLICRKTRASLTQTALVTWKDHVQPPGSSAAHLWTDQQEYRYPNGSIVAIGGLDKEGEKIMSGEFHAIYVQEATELAEAEWDKLTTRINRLPGMPYNQLIADCNPQAPMHWLKRRCERGDTLMLESRHEDNPVLYDGTTWTEQGRAYIAGLDRLTGVRKARLRYGKWAAAEGLIYDGWDANVHIVTLPEFTEDVDDSGVPLSWPRYWSIDWGYVLRDTPAGTHPFVWQAWAMNPKGRLYLYREIYRTSQIVEDSAAQILEATKGEPRPQAIICDHDPGDRATFERKVGMSTVAAKKDVKAGIDAVMARLRVGDDGEPGLVVVANSLVTRDPGLDEAGYPCSWVEEIDGYVWNDRTTKEQPRKVSDHSMDAGRYLVAYFDLSGGPAVVSDDDIWS